MAAKRFRLMDSDERKGLGRFRPRPWDLLRMILSSSRLARCRPRIAKDARDVSDAEGTQHREGGGAAVLLQRRREVPAVVDEF